MKIHETAVIDAIKMTPENLRKVLEPLEKSIIKELPSVHAMSKSERKDYETSFNELRKMLKKPDDYSTRFIAREFAAITMYAFLKSNPVQITESCNADNFLPEVRVMYDGFAPAPNYAAMTSINFTESVYQYEKGLLRDNKLIQFYDILANEIADIWTASWKAAGNELSGLVAANTYVRGTPKIKKASVTVLNESAVPSGNFSDASLNKYKEEADAHKRMRKEFRNVDQMSEIQDQKARINRMLEREDTLRKAVQDVNEERD